jgi:cysteinyl-tRNA synthetase
MDDDLNSRAAISALFELVRDVNRLLSEGRLSKQGAENVIGVMEEVDQVFGILPAPVTEAEDRSGELVELLIDVRNELRKRKLYDLADRIRDGLKTSGIELQDTSEGVRWKRVS